jgi:hypothetical protein
VIRWLRRLLFGRDDLYQADPADQEVRDDRDARQQVRLEEVTRKADRALREISRVEAQFEAQARLRGRKWE